MIQAEGELCSETIDILCAKGPYQLKGKRNALLTANIVLAFLKRFEILQAPAKTAKRFTWFHNVVTDEDVQALAEQDFDSSLLYICTEDRAPAILEISPSAFLLVVSRSGVTPDGRAAIETESCSSPATSV